MTTSDTILATLSQGPTPRAKLVGILISEGIATTSAEAHQKLALELEELMASGRVEWCEAWGCYRLPGTTPMEPKEDEPKPKKTATTTPDLLAAQGLRRVGNRFERMP